MSIKDQKGIWACLGLHGKCGHAWVGLEVLGGDGRKQEVGHW